MVDPRIEELEHEYLARQTALTEVLKVIGRAAFDLESVLKAIVSSAASLCQAEFGTIYLREDDVYRVVTGVGEGANAVAYERDHPDRPGRHSVTGRVLLSGEAVQIEDVLADAEYDQSVAQELTGFRTLLGLPILRDGRIEGVIDLGRAEVRPFIDTEIALAATFAEQVSIAIQNARLIETIENQRREHVDRQTALAEILRIIGDSSNDLPTVLQRVLDGAARLCAAEFGTIYLADGDVYRVAAGTGHAGREVVAYERDHPDHPGRHSMTGRVLLTRGPVQIEDVLADGEYKQPEAQRLVGFRTLLGLPILRGADIAGVFNLGRASVRPFSEAEVALVATFAEQVAVAIENARLIATIERQRSELSRFISPQIAELVSSSDGEQLLAGHRRQITAVFADLRGFSQFAESAEPEELLGVLREYHAAMGAIVVAFAGTLEHFAGDGMLVFFNDPIPQDDHVGRATLMALSMRERFAQLADGWRKLGFELGLGIGIATGYATLGRIGYEGRYDYAAIGTAVILASRLSSEAQAGQILIGQRTLGAIETEVEVEPVGELTLKGITRAVPAFNVLRTRASGDA